MKKVLVLTLLVSFGCLMLTSLACNSTPAATTPAAASANCTVKYGLQTPQATLAPVATGLLLSQMINVPLTVTAKSVNIYASTGGSADFARVGIYSDNAGVPDALLVQSGSTAIVANAWNNVTITDTVLTAGDYWIAVTYQTGQVMTFKGTGGFYYYNSSVVYGALPASFPAGSSGIGKVTMALSVCQ